MADRPRRKSKNKTPGWPGDAEGLLVSGAHADFPTFAHDILRIQTKNGSFAPLDFNVPQQKRWDLIQRIQAAGEPVRIWEAKARQTGCSTFCQGYLFHRCVTRMDETALVVAHTADTVHEIFTKTKLFHVSMPEEIKPQTKYDNRAALDFRAPNSSEGLRSRFTVVLPKHATSANGITARGVHVSEIALYDNPKAFMLNMLQTVPDELDTFVYVESTCEGGGDYHHEQYLAGRVFGDEIPPWMPLKEKFPGNPDSQWYVIFTPWFLMGEYTKPLRVSETAFRASLDQDEQDLLDRFGDYVTLEQLQWRRETISTKCGGDVAGFRQQYPSTDEEAFGATGRLVFDRDDVKRQEESHVCACEVCIPYVGYEPAEDNDCPPHEWCEIIDASGWVRDRGERMFTTYKPEVIEANPGMGKLSIWKRPEPRHNYIAAADVSAGHEDGDWDVICVVDEATLEQVAEWRGKIDMVEFADVCMLVALYYNNAMLAPEVTGAGQGLIAMLQHTRYWKIYRRKNLGQAGAAGSPILGWSTTSHSKNQAVGLLIKAMRERYVRFRSRALVEEAGAYRAAIVTSSSEGVKMLKMSAPSGKHDDALMAMIIASAVAHGGFRLNKVNKALVEPDPWDARTWDDGMWSDHADQQLELTLAAAGHYRQ